MSPPHQTQLITIALLSTSAAIVVGFLVYQRRRKQSKRRVTFQLPDNMLPATNAKVLGLLFAASWCPDCTDVVPAIGKCVEKVDKSFLEVFYVSSDRNDDEMKGFLPDSLNEIPFQMADQRRHLKQKYLTCAAKEMEELGLSNRDYGLPTLMLIEASSGRVLTQSAHEDVMNVSNAEEIVKQWKALL